MTIQGIHVSGYKLSKQQNSFKKMVDLFFQNKSFYNIYFFFQEIHVNLLTHLGKLLCFPDTR